MSERMKSPKTKDNKVLSDDVEYILIGLMLILLSIIGLLNKGPVGNFITYITIYLFGAYYFILYAILFMLSLYLMLKKKVYRIHINMKLLGAILVFVSLLIASSSTTTELRFSNLTQLFNEHMSSVSSSIFVIDNISNLAVTGGGFIGFALKALLNTTVTSVGTTIVYIVFLSVGLVLLLKDVVAYIIRFFVNFEYKNKKKKEAKIETREIVQEEKNDDIPQITRLVNEEIEEVKTQETDEVNVEEKPILVNKPIIEELNIPKPKQNISSFFIDDIEDFSKKEEREEVTEIKEPEFISTTNEVKKEPELITDIEILKPAYSETKMVDVFPVIEKKPLEESIEKKEIKFSAELQEMPKKEEKNEENKTPKVEKLYQYPPVSLLKIHATEDTYYENKRVAIERMEKINNTFVQYRIGAQVISYTIGPSVTRFNVKMNEGVRVNTLSSVTNEISIALNGDKTVRLEMVVEGRDTSSIEVGNLKPSGVSFKECFEQIKHRTSEKDKLLIPLGKDIEGKVVTTSMEELPHLLVAGTTGSGKSVFINTIIATFIMRNNPDELKLMLIDPKKVEFSKYNNLPHLLCPIITDAREGKEALKRLVQEMERRYEMLSSVGASKISEYNEFAEIQGFEKMPNIVLVCDEFSDFMSEYGKDIEQSVKRLAQKARACGIYLIICTQRPSVNVITGDIKAVVPSRVGLLVPQYVDSKTILDEGGAESLLGNGDMLCRIPRHNSLVRVQGAFISGVEIIQICQFIKDQREPEYDKNFLDLVPQQVVTFNGIGPRRKEIDELHEQAKEFVIRTRNASTNSLQNQFGIGFVRADHILSCLQDEGIVKKINNRRVVVAPAPNDDDYNQN